MPCDRVFARKFLGGFTVALAATALWPAMLWAVTNVATLCVVTVVIVGLFLIYAEPVINTVGSGYLSLFDAFSSAASRLSARVSHLIAT